MIRAALALALVGCAGSGGDPDEALSGGPFTVFDTGPNAFGHPVPGLGLDDERAFFRGRALFRDDWVAAPASTMTRDGLGPVFNARSCEACHVADGRGRPPVGDEQELGPMLLRLGLLDGAAAVPEPTYGGQFQPFGILGVAGEGRAIVEYEELAGTYGDGTPFTLRRPRFELVDLNYGPLAAGTRLSPRVPPQMIGLGMLAAVDDATLEELADPDDRDRDGISGRRGARFGLKASQPSIAHQVAAAFNGDLGLTSQTFPVDDCTASQPACRDAPDGGAPEVVSAIEHDVTQYSRLLAVPARRAWDAPEVVRGKAAFEAIGCATCHRPTLVTGLADELFGGIEIHPYTDLLLHDLGPALADELPDHGADGREWRTAPLWGIGLTRTVSGHELLLHDGRARGFAEAILWHGGEAEPAREAFRNLAKGDRDDLLAFLASL